MSAGNFRGQTNSPDSEQFGLYIHVPFCLRKCPYCSFYSTTATTSLVDRYLRALTRQISWFKSHPWTENKRAATIFFGGGTPTTLPVQALTNLLAVCRGSFAIEIDTLETTLEINPATLTRTNLLALRQGGFNRLSIGVQSLDAKELKQLGRPHGAEEAEETVRSAGEAGFENISIDLMFGLPGQNPSSWLKTLEKGVALEPDHLSIYELTVEDKTPFFYQVKDGSIMLPEEEHVLQMMAITADCLADTDLQRYEISNYALAGKQCCHNLNYWHNSSYIGLGPGAVSNLSGHRFTACNDVELFCRLIENNQEPWSEEERLDNEGRFRETVIMGLRMTQGITLADLRNRFQLDLVDYYGDTLNRLIKQELLALTDDSLRLTKKGLFVANSVMAELV